MTKIYRGSLVGAAVFMLITSGQGAIMLPGTLQEPTEELTKRFDKILAEKLSGKKVMVTDDAKEDLNKIVHNAAQRIVEKNEFGKLDEADKSFKALAAALTRKQPFIDEVEVTPKTIDEVLNGKLNPLASDPTQRLSKGLCPLFPICS